MLAAVQNHFGVRSSSGVVADARLALKIGARALRSEFSTESSRAHASLRLLQSRFHGAFTHVVHLRVHPLRSIAELAAMNSTEWATADLLTNTFASNGANPLVRALHHWIAVNQYIDMFADCGFRLEAVLWGTMSSSSRSIASRDCDAALSARILANFAGSFDELDSSLAQSLHRRYGELKSTSWESLHKADPFMARVACAIAQHYGYNCPLFANREDYYTIYYPKDTESSNAKQ